jgi:small subunit ribosomal protein S21
LAEVRIQEGESLENALRRFKRKVQQEDIIKEVKRHSFYLKPGEKKRVKEALARKRSRKKARKEQDRVLLGHSFPGWPIPFDPRFQGQVTRASSPVHVTQGTVLAEASSVGRVQGFPTGEGATILRPRTPRLRLASAQARAEGSVSSWNFRTRC